MRQVGERVGHGATSLLFFLLLGLEVGHGGKFGGMVYTALLSDLSAFVCAIFIFARTIVEKRIRIRLEGQRIYPAALASSRPQPFAEQ